MGLLGQGLAMPLSLMPFPNNETLFADLFNARGRPHSGATAKRSISLPLGGNAVAIYQFAVEFRKTDIHSTIDGRIDQVP